MMKKYRITYQIQKALPSVFAFILFLIVFATVFEQIMLFSSDKIELCELDELEEKSSEKEEKKEEKKELDKIFLEQKYSKECVFTKTQFYTRNFFILEVESDISSPPPENEIS